MSAPLASDDFILRALINTVHDGDTLYGPVDHGAGLWNHGLSKNGMGLRLWGCNAAEIEEPGGPEARDYLATLIPVGSYIPIRCRKWDKYAGRFDVSITLPSGEDLVEKLITEKWAARWNGTGPKPVPAWPRAA